MRVMHEFLLFKARETNASAMSTQKNSEERIDEAIQKAEAENAYQDEQVQQKVKSKPQQASVSMFYKPGTQVDLNMT